MFAVFKREFKAYFQSVIGWLFVAALLAMFGLYFYVYNLMQGYPYIYYTLSAITIIFLIAVPVLTMRSFAEERKNKTDQLILTAPVSLGKIVFGKYLAMVAVFTVDIAIFCIAPLLLRLFGTVPMGESYIAILAFWLYGSACIAVGMFISSLTESQVIAAVLSFAVLFISYMMQSITGLISSEGNWLTKILNCFDLYAPFDKFSGGCLDLTAIVYYVTVIVLLNFLTVQSIQKRRWSMNRRMLSTGVFSVSLIAAALALTVVVNLVVNVMPTDKTAIDCSYSKLYSITDDTKEAVGKLKEDVTIYALVAENKKDSQIDTILKRYEDLSKHVKVEYVNPSAKPYFYQDYTDSAPTKNSLIVVGEKRSKVIDYYDIYHYESNMDYSTYSYTNDLVGFDAEGQLTSAIEYVTMDEEQLPIVYEVTGHEERSIGSEFQDVIKKANMTLSSVELLNEECVPDDAAAIIINAPQTDFNESDANKVIDYLKNGGKAIIVGSYTGNSMPNFESILETYGVGFTGGLVAENDAQHYYNMGGPFYLLPEVNSSSYTGSIGGSYIYIPASMGITFPESSETITYTSLMDTTDRAVSKSDPNQMQDYQYEEGDIEGPFSVGLAVEENVDDENTTQLLVFASPYIFAEEASQMTVNNSVLFSDAISNLVPQTQAAGSIIAEKEYTLDNLTVSAMYAVLLGLMLTIAVPLILVILGIVIFVIRRKK
ncbi:MAG: Gldg family protein [Agathobacter sp.]|nr:Gldg family protein [Agathobacter sp.]